MKVPTPFVPIRGFIDGCLEAVSAAFRRMPAALGRHRSGRAPSQLALLAGLGGSVVVLFLLLLVAALRSGPRPVSTETGAAQAAGKAAGTAIASSLVIPGEGVWPWPLALEPRSRYTEADAAEMRPDLGAIDVSSLTKRRKAQLESILEAVD